MKDPFEWIIIAALITYIVLLSTCKPMCPECPEYIAFDKTDTVFVEKTKYIALDVPTPVKVTPNKKPVKSTTVTTIENNFIPATEKDSIVYNKYSKEYEDSIVKIKLNAVVEGTLIDWDLKYNFKYPIITKVQTVKPTPKNQLILGMSFGYIHNVRLPQGLITTDYLTKNGIMYKAQYDLLNKGGIVGIGIRL
jgi:hypothetical protein